MPKSKVGEIDPSLKIYFSTVVRSAPRQQGGEIVLVDWNSKTVEAKHPIIPGNPELVDPNPRGNTRGGRGIDFWGDDVIVANYHTLQIFDHRLHHKQDISHPLLVGLHEIFSNGDGRIWASSTAIDAVLGIDIKKNVAFHQYWPREISGIQRALNLVPLEIDKGVDNRTKFLEKKHTLHPSHLHLNAVANWDGEIYGLFNSFGVIANLDKDEIVIQDKSLHQPHNLLIEEDGIAIVNNTNNYAVHIYDLKTRKLIRTIKLTQFGLVRRLLLQHQPNYLARGLLKKFFIPHISAPRPVFLRGLDKVGDYLFVGISPATILCIDFKSGRLLDSYTYSNKVNVCVHGLKVLAAEKH